MPLKMLWKFSAKNDILSWEITHDKVWCVMEDNRRFSDEEFDDMDLDDIDVSEEDIEIIDVNEDDSEDDLEERSSKGFNFKLLIPIILVIVAVCVAAGIFVVKNTESKKKVDLYKYYGIESERDGMIVTVNGVVVEGEAYVSEGVCYLSNNFIKEYITDKFYYDKSALSVLYTTPYEVLHIPLPMVSFVEDWLLKYSYPVATVVGEEVFLAADFVKDMAEFEYQIIDNPDRLAVTLPGTAFDEVVFNGTAAIRESASIKASILGKSDETVKWYYKEDAGAKWYHVYSEDGRYGYVKKEDIKEINNVVTEEREKVEYPNLIRDHEIVLIWDAIYDLNDNKTVAGRLEKVTNANVISPTWYKVADVKGNLESMADKDYVAYVKSLGYEIWPLISDFISVDKERGFSEKELLSTREYRRNLINNIMKEISEYGYDGINVDFEKVKADTGEDYVQFIRELSIECRKAGVVLSVDNYIPAGHTMHYGRDAQGECVDYVIVMCYDEHYVGGDKAGSTASINFVVKGMNDTLKYVDKEKLIVGVPFYTRLWSCESDAEDAEIIDSKAYSMDGCRQIAEELGLNIQWNDEVKQYVAEGQSGSHYYRIWLETMESMEARVDEISKAGVAGIAAWELRFANDEVWNIFERISID